MITAKWRNLEDLTKATIRLEDKVTKGAENLVNTAAQALVNDIKSSWSSSSPSAPGSPPAVVTGTLDSSVQAETGRDTLGRFASAGSVVTRIVRVRAGHGALLENGTYKMAARPFMRPATERLADTYPGIAKRTIVL